MAKETADPWTGESSSIEPSKATLVFTANATGLARPWKQAEYIQYSLYLPFHAVLCTLWLFLTHLFSFIQKLEGALFHETRWNLPFLVVLGPASLCPFGSAPSLRPGWGLRIAGCRKTHPNPDGRWNCTQAPHPDMQHSMVTIQCLFLGEQVKPGFTNYQPRGFVKIIWK